MAENAGNATVDLIADPDQLERGLKEGSDAILAFERNAERASPKVSKFSETIKGVNRAFSDSVGAVLSWIGKLSLVATALGLVGAAVNAVTEALARKQREAKAAEQAMIALAEKTEQAFAKITAALAPRGDEFDTLLEDAKRARDEALEAERMQGPAKQTPEEVQAHRDRLAQIEERYQAAVEAIEQEAERQVGIRNRNRRLDAEAEARKKESQDKEKQRAAELEEIGRRMLDVAKQMADEQTRAAESAEKALEAQRAATREIIKQRTELRALQDQQRQGFDLSDLADDAAGTGAVLQLINSAIARGGGR